MGKKGGSVLTKGLKKKDRQAIGKLSKVSCACAKVPVESDGR
jgi:hypothetical protein